MPTSIAQWPAATASGDAKRSPPLPAAVSTTPRLAPQARVRGDRRRAIRLLRAPATCPAQNRRRTERDRARGHALRLVLARCDGMSVPADSRAATAERAIRPLRYRGAGAIRTAPQPVPSSATRRASSRKRRRGSIPTRASPPSSPGGPRAIPTVSAPARGPQVPRAQPRTSRLHRDDALGRGRRTFHRATGQFHWAQCGRPPSTESRQRRLRAHDAQARLRRARPLPPVHRRCEPCGAHDRGHDPGSTPPRSACQSH